MAIALRGAIPALVPDEEPQAEALDVLGEVLGLPPQQSQVTHAGPQIRRQALVRGLRSVLAAAAKRAPMVLVLEDLHWIDDASQEVLTDVLGDVLGLRVLALAAQRPGWTPPWNEWGWPERMTLRALGDAEGATLAAAVLGGKRLSPELEHYVADRAGGNPFFVEEMLRALQETGGLEEREGLLYVGTDAAEKLPPTLTEVLLARLDRLEGPARGMAQVASVIGRSFAVRLLAEVVGEAPAALEPPLAQLQRAEIAFPRRNPDLEYVFKHVSMRDVAYNTLIQKRRQELHLRTAVAIAALYPSDEYVEIIAYHYGQTEAPEAAEWLERAGQRAAAIYANEAAIEHLRDARKRFDISGASDTVLARIDEKLGEVLVTSAHYDEALEVLERAAEVCRQVRDLEGAGRVTARIGIAHRWHGSPEQGVTRVRRMIDCRERELALLQQALRSAADGKGRLVTILGEAGAGKSRLINEGLKLASASEPVQVLRARCLSYSQGISLWLVSDLLRTIFDIKEQEDRDRVRAKLNAQVPDLLREVSSETQAEVIDVVGQVLGLGAGVSDLSTADAQIRHHALIRGLRMLLNAIAERSLTVLVLEDLHWLDTTSQEVLTEILAGVSAMHLLVLAAQRPGWKAPWAEWEWAERIALEPLGQQEAVTLAQAVLSGVSLSDGLASYIADRSGGNPFFLEEMLRALRDTHEIVERDGCMEMVPGAAERLPPTLTEMLLARLDRLDRDVRSVAQAASVIGRNFAVRLLPRVIHQEPEALEPFLAALQESEIAFPRSGSELEYMFKHVSMRDVAYNTLVQKRRRQLHLEAARASASLYPADEYVEMIAYHYSNTLEHAEAAQWLERAGDRAASVYASDTAAANYQEARKRLELIEGDELAIARLDEKQGGVFYTAGRYDEAIEPLERAIAVYGRAGSPEPAGLAAAQLGMVHRYRGTPDEGLSHVQPVIEQLANTGFSEALAALNIALASNLFLKGRYPETLEAAERAMEYARKIEEQRLLGEAEERRGVALLLLGQPEEALKTLEAALPKVEAGGDYTVLWRNLNNLATACERLGQMARIRGYCQRSLEVAELTGNASRICFTLSNLSAALFTLGDWEEARGHLTRAMALAPSAGTAADTTTTLAYLGQLDLQEGNLEEASVRLNEALAQARHVGDRQTEDLVQTSLAELDLMQGRPQEAYDRIAPLINESGDLNLLLPVMAWTYLELGEPGKALKTAQQAVARARENRALLHLVYALWVEGMVLTAIEDWGEAQRDLEVALTMAKTMPYPYAEGRILRQYGLLNHKQGQLERASERLQAACQIFERLGARWDLERTHEALTQLSPAAVKSA
ncbi:MAG: ATP-binding protein [Chloroflexota bacterium]